MATLIPPPSKKQKREERLAIAKLNAGISEPSPAAPAIVVQFTSSMDGAPIGPPVRLPADTDKAGLELLANQLRKAQKQASGNDDEENEDDDEPTPFSFHVALPARGEEKEGDRVQVVKDLHQVIKSNESRISIEDILTVVCEPEAVFKVRQITRCSSTLSGEYTSITSH